MNEEVDTLDPNALLSLPEFVRELQPSPEPEPVTPPVQTHSSKFMRRTFKPSRSRSLSAPPLTLAWLLPSSLSGGKWGSSNAAAAAEEANTQQDRQSPPLRAGLEVQYVAEHQDNLGSVAVFLNVEGAQAGADVEAEVFPSGGERLIVKSGASTSPPLALPARVTPGKKDVKVQNGHFEMKLQCASGQQTNGSVVHYDADSPGTGLLDATQIKAMNPTTFICASCSLPLVQGAKVVKYDDLPSEHWAELVEAWMCHSDQKISDRIALYANGLYPAPTQALVGGSYILFDASVLQMNNVGAAERPQVRISFYCPPFVPD